MSSNLIGDNVVTTTITALTTNSNVVGDNVTAVTTNSNLIGDNVTAVTVSSNLIGDNVVTTTITALTTNSNVVADNVNSVTIRSNLIGNNVITTNDITGGTTLYVKESTKRVGINKSNPTKALDVTGEIECSSDLTVGGDLVVNGVTTTVNTTTLSVQDKIIEIGKDNTSGTTDLGIIMSRPTSNVAIFYNEGDDKLQIGHTTSLPTDSDITLDASNKLDVNIQGDLDVGVSNLYVDVSASRVGILTSTPGYTLDVHGTANVGAFTATSGNLSGDLVVDTNTLKVNSSTNRVGILTTAPGFTLDVRGTANVGAFTATTIAGSGASITAINAGNITTGILSRPIDTSTGVFTGDVTISGSAFIGSSTRGLRSVTGDYGTVQTRGEGAGNWEGYSIDGRYVFMSEDNNACGIYNDLDNEWMIYCARNAGTYLYYNGVQKLVTDNGGVTVSGTVTATTFSGALSGNASTATKVYSTSRDSINSTHYLTFVDSHDNGNRSIYQDDGLTYNPSTQTLAATTFSGNATSASTAAECSGSAAQLGGVALDNIFNNMGGAHTDRTDFDAVPDAGCYYITGITNGPGVNNATQYYGFTLGLGGHDPVYKGNNNGKYGSQIYWGRNVSSPYINIRYLENGSWGSWQKAAAGYADSAGTAGTAGTATNQSGGTVSATTGSFSGGIQVFKDGVVAEYKPATAGDHTLINFWSKQNYGSDRGFILVQDESSNSPGTGAEDLRMTIGVFNDFRSSASHSDELWFQGGGRLVYNVGDWDDELDTIIGTPGYGTTGGHEWRTSNSTKMVLSHSGNLGIGQSSPTYKLDVSGTGRFTGTVTAPTFSGSLSGNASSASTAATCTGNSATASQVNNSLTPGSYLTGAAFNGSTARTFAVDATSGDTGDKVMARNSSGDTYCRLFRSTYTNESTISGAIAYRVDTNNNYIRFCNDKGAIRGFLDVPTTTGGDASGTWGINITGSSASCTGNSATATTASVADSTNGNGKIVVQNGTNGGSTRGIWMWTSTDSNWGIYMGQAGSNRSLSGGTASSFSTVTSHAIRFRVYDNFNNGFIFENGSESLLLGLRASDGYMVHYGSMYNSGTLESDGRIYADNGVHVRGDWLRVNGTNGIYFESYGGGWYMSDQSWVRAYNSKSIYTAGDVYAAGNVTAYSDIRQKKDLAIIDNALQKVEKINGYTYTNMKDEKRYTGVVAQEVLEVLPEAVVENREEGHYAVAYGNMVGLLIEAIKELKSEIDELKKSK